mgnify:CR=1 FL=1
MNTLKTLVLLAGFMVSTAVTAGYAVISVKVLAEGESRNASLLLEGDSGRTWILIEGSNGVPQWRGIPFESPMRLHTQMLPPERESKAQDGKD